MSSWSDENCRKRVERILATIPSEHNRGIVRRYLTKRAARGKKASTLATDANTLRNLAVWLGDRKLEHITEDALAEYLVTERRLRTWRNARADGDETVTTREVGLSETTRHQRATVLKTFYSSLFGSKETAEKLFAEVMPARVQPKLAPEKLVSETHMEALLKATTSDASRALLAFLYETGLRASELASLNVGSVRTTEWGAFLTMPPKAARLKTGPRTVWVLRTESWPFVERWLHIHPNRADPNAPLFPKMHGNEIGGRHDNASLWSFLSALGARAGVEGLGPHRLRHTAVTNRVKQGWNEDMLRVYFGWSKSSDMPSVYSQATMDDCLETDLRQRGLDETRPVGVSALSPLTCAACATPNPRGVLFCKGCNSPVDPAAVAAYRAREDARFEEVLAKSIASLQERGDLPEILRRILAAEEVRKARI